METLYEWFNNTITELIELMVIAVFIGVPLLLLMVLGRAIGLWKWGR